MQRRLLLIGFCILVFFVGGIMIWKCSRGPSMRFTQSESSIAYDSVGMMGVSAGVPAPQMMPYSDEKMIMQPPFEQTGSTGVLPEGATRLLVKTGQMSVVTDSVEEKSGEVRRYVEEKKGFVVGSQVYNLDTAPQAVVTVRIPAAEFENTIAHIREMGVVKDESVSGNDVTEEYIDLDAQLKNYQATEAQFLEIMQRAQKIEDVLAVQRELMSVRSSIERIEGRMKYLTESATYSTLTVYLSSDSASLPVIDDSDEWKPVGVFKEALRSLVELGKSLVGALIWVAVYAPVWIIIGAIVFVGIRKIKTKK